MFAWGGTQTCSKKQYIWGVREGSAVPEGIYEKSSSDYF